MRRGRPGWFECVVNGHGQRVRIVGGKKPSGLFPVTHDLQKTKTQWAMENLAGINPGRQQRKQELVAWIGAQCGDLIQKAPRQAIMGILARLYHAGKPVPSEVTIRRYLKEIRAGIKP